MKKIFLYLLCFCVFASCGNESKKIVQSEYVDLGLPSGILWARCNVGASLPGQFGDYFTNMSNDDISLTYGKDLRLPTRKDFQELIDNCKWEWTVQDYHHGYKVIGPSGESIFLPAAGNIYVDEFRESTFGTQEIQAVYPAEDALFRLNSYWSYGEDLEDGRDCHYDEARYKGHYFNDFRFEDFEFERSSSRNFKFTVRLVSGSATSVMREIFGDK